MKKLYIGTAILAFIIALVAQFPARLAWNVFGTHADPAQIQVINISGTALSGQASVLLRNSLVLKAQQWDARFLPLLIGRLKYDLAGTLESYPINGVITLLPTGSVRIADLQISMPVKLITPLLPVPIMPFNGMLSVDVNDISLTSQKLKHASGVAEVRNAEWTLMRPALPLGNLRADLSTEDGTVNADLSSTGALELAGQAKLLPENGYEIDIRLRSRPEAEERLNNLLKTLGRPVDGWYRIKMQGTLPTRP